MDRSNAAKAVGHIAGLDLLRFFAALAVAVYHLSVAIVVRSDSGIIVGHRAAYPELFRLAWPGFIGVEIFFVISGAVISHSAMNQTPWRFLRSRALRLYPAAWVCVSLSTVVCGALHLFGTGELIRRWAGSMLLLPRWTWIDSVYWTLGVEMVFYLGVFALLLVASPRFLYRFGLGVGLASMAYLMVGAVFWPSFLVHNLFKWMDLSLLPYGVYFGLGMVLSLRRDRLSPLDLVFIAGALSAAYIEISLRMALNHATFGSPQAPIVPMLVFVLAVGAVVLSFRMPTPPQVTRVFRVLGRATYPLYLLHDVTGAAIIRWLSDAGLGRWEALGASLAIVIAASIGISQWVEPAIRSALAPGRSVVGRRASLDRAGMAPSS